MSAFTKPSAGALTAVRTELIFGNVTWHCNDGHLTLRGCVPNFYLKQVLQELLHGIEQVKQITNSVDVVSSTGMSSERPLNPNSGRSYAGPHACIRNRDNVQVKPTISGDAVVINRWFVWRE